jgi:hypothetical protein
VDNSSVPLPREGEGVPIANSKALEGFFEGFF